MLSFVSGPRENGQLERVNQMGFVQLTKDAFVQPSVVVVVGLHV